MGSPTNSALDATKQQLAAPQLPSSGAGSARLVEAPGGSIRHGILQPASRWALARPCREN